MEKIKLTIPSSSYHIGQITTGVLMLREQGCPVEIVDQSRNPGNPFYALPLAVIDYQGKKLVYDLWDGYQNPDGMQLALQDCDFYFKRSFDPERNARLFPQYAEKMHPLGLYYRVTHPGNPTNEPLWKCAARLVLGKTPDRYFTPAVFEGNAEDRGGAAPRILFLTQLWDDPDPAISREDQLERSFINQMRIEVIQTLRDKFGSQFVGGLSDTALSRALAPELIMDKAYTERRRYIALVHESDICIGSMGLYESIGGKTGEYVAAAKAIVNERLHYVPTGDFAAGRNYLPFENARECVAAVEQLAGDPEARLQMQQANRDYYLQYLRPDMLVKNTLDIAAGLPG